MGLGQTLGIKVESMNEGHAVLTLPDTPAVANGNGVIHGGAICTLIDNAIGAAVHSLLTPADWQATTDLQVRFLAPGKGLLTARAEIVRAGGTLAVGTCEVRDPAGTLIALGSGTFALRRGERARRVPPQQ